MTVVDFGTVFKGSKSGKIVTAQGAKHELGPNEVVIDIAYSGLCGTDMHYRCRSDMVLGHEGVGKISQVGSAVDVVKVGDRAGWGYNHDSCDYCDHCWNGYDTMCPKRKVYGYANLEWGSFGGRAVLDAHFVHKIPDEISFADAAPLQCGGATVFGAMVNSGVKSTDRVGVIGIGGLGHLAIQFANKMGCEVVVFSSTHNKEQLARKLGAHEFVVTKENPKLEGVGKLDYLLVSTSQQPEWDVYFKIMNSEGTVIPLTVSTEKMSIPYSPLLANNLKVHGSFVARRLVHRQMLEFAARNNVRPMTEELPMTEAGVNEAFERLEKGDVRFRFVLKSTQHDDK
ncbi:alcohol dehydrogenase (NADP(+)) [Malassezia sp. CBS 17886]|nr:alcohol dehydrogenase (NADP(+)) [Malassezia sp. CBS 17886]